MGVNGLHVEDDEDLPCEVELQAERSVAVLQGDLGQGLLRHFLYKQHVHLFQARRCGICAGVASHLFAACGFQRLRMLRGTDSSVDPLGLHRFICPLQVLEGHLRLANGAQPTQQSAFADIRQLISQARRN